MVDQSNLGQQEKPLLVVGCNFGTNERAQIVGIRVRLFKVRSHDGYGSVDFGPDDEKLRVVAVSDAGILPITSVFYTKDLQAFIGIVDGCSPVPNAQELNVFLLKPPLQAAPFDIPSEDKMNVVRANVAGLEPRSLARAVAELLLSRVG